MELVRHEWLYTSTLSLIDLSTGTGKTYLTSRVIDEIRHSLKHHPNHEGFAFFYCNRNEPQRREPLSVLRSFVRQLSTPIRCADSIQRELRQFYSESRLDASEPTLDDCEKYLLKFISVYLKTTLILDALDECERDQRHKLINYFHAFLAKTTRPVKIFVSSRPDSDIKNTFKDVASVEIQATDNYDDISKFISSKIAEHEKWKTMNKAFETEIVNTLQRQSQGM